MKRTISFKQNNKNKLLTLHHPYSIMIRQWCVIIIKYKTMAKTNFYRGVKVELTKFTREHNVCGWISTIYYGVIADMGDIDDNRPTPNTAELDPASIMLKDGTFINFGNKYELRLI